MILSESLRTAREFAAKHIIPEYIFKKFDWIDFTPTKKYINQILKWYIANTEIELLDRYFIKHKLEEYDKAIQNIEPNRRQIESFGTWDEFEKFMDDYAEKNIKPEIHKNVVFENDKILIIRPGNKETVCKYGKGTQWCITMTDRETEDDDHYNRYRFEMGYTFYYCIVKDKSVFDKTGLDPDKYVKMCAIVDRSGDIEEVYDSMDEQLPYDGFIEILKRCGANFPKLKNIQKVFISVPVTFSEKMSRVLDGVEYTIQNNKFTVDGDLDFSIFSDDGIEKLPIKLDIVRGSVYAGEIFLKTTENLPRKCTGTVSLFSNYITNISEGLEEYDCLDLSDNELISTKNIPMVKQLFLSENINLKKLEGLEHQDMELINISNTGLESLEGIPHANTIYCNSTEIESLNELKFKDNRVYDFSFTYNLNLKDIEILRTLPDSCNITIIRFKGCPNISRAYAEEVLAGKKVGIISC